MDVQFLITCQLGNLLMLLGEITCWSFLRVIGLNDHSVFFFFCFSKVVLRKHMQVLSTPVDILLSICEDFWSDT